MDLCWNCKCYWRSSSDGKQITEDYLERANKIPARISRLPTTSMTLTNIWWSSDCNTFSTSSFPVITINMKAKITNPMKDRRPPKAILRRFLRSMRGITGSPNHDIFRIKIMLLLSEGNIRAQILYQNLTLSFLEAFLRVLPIHSFPHTSHFLELARTLILLLPHWGHRSFLPINPSAPLLDLSSLMP